MPNLIALKLASVDIVAPLGAFSLAVNVVNAHLLLDEPIHYRDVISTAVIMAGCGICASLCRACALVCAVIDVRYPL